MPWVEEADVLLVNGEHHGRRRTMGRRIADPAYAINDDTAIKVVDGAVDVISEGHWKLSGR